MKVAIFSQQFPVISETFVIDQVLGLKNKGHHVDVITLNCPCSIKGNDLISKNNLEGNIINFSVGISKWEKVLKFFFSVMKLIFIQREMNSLIDVLFDKYLDLEKKIVLINVLSNDNLKIKYEYDNIIVHFGDYGYFISKLIDMGKLSGKLTIIYHGYEMSVFKSVKRNLKQYKKSFDKADNFLPISKLWKKRLVDWGCPIEKIQVQHMGVDVASLENNKERCFDFDKIKLIQVGRLVEKKAILDSISAVILARKEYHLDLEFNIIGDGPLLKDAQKIIKENDATYIKILGAQSHEVTKKYLKSSNVFILPSVKAVNGDMEGIPVALMEAMVSGLIVISTRHSGIPELVTDKVNGYLVDEHSPEQIAEVLAEISHLSETDIEEIRFNAFQKVNNEFNNDKLYDQLINLICQS